MKGHITVVFYLLVQQYRIWQPFLRSWSNSTVLDLMLYTTHLLTEFHRLPCNLWNINCHVMCLAGYMVGNWRQQGAAGSHLLGDCPVPHDLRWGSSTAVKWNLASLAAVRKIRMAWLEKCMEVSIQWMKAERVMRDYEELADKIPVSLSPENLFKESIF